MPTPEQFEKAEIACDEWKEAMAKKASSEVIEEKRIAYEKACEPFKKLF